MALSITFLGDYPGFQVMIQIKTSIFILIFFIRSMPFESRQQSSFEFINEITLLVQSYLLAPLAIGVDSDSEQRIGWIMIIITLINIGANYLSLLCSIINSLYLVAKKLWSKLCYKPT